MIKSIPKQEEVKNLARNIYKIANKLNGTIQINSLDDAANLAAYFYGFSSWKEYSAIHKIEEENKIQEEFHFKKPKFKTQIIKKDHLEVNLEKFKYQNQNLQLKESTVLPTEWLIGKKRDKYEKVETPIGLLSKNYLVTSSPLKPLYQLVNNQLNWLLDYKQKFAIFGFKEDFINENLKQRFNNENIFYFHKESYKLDPIEESLKYDNIETLLEINTEENQTFSWLWILLIKTLRKELNIKWSYQDLLESLTIKFLLSAIEKIDSMNLLINKPLQNYLYKTCGVILEENNFIVSEESQQKHYLQTYVLREKIENIGMLYEKGYFSEKSQNHLIDLVFEKQSFVISDCVENNLKKTYWDCINTTYLNAIKKHNKEIKQYDANSYKIWSIWLNAENSLNKVKAQEILNQHESLIAGIYITSENHDLAVLFENFNQIVFLKQYFSQYPIDWLQKSLVNTDYWEDNIWFENYRYLKELNENEAYIWQQKDNLVPQNLEIYNLKKIQLY